MSVLIQSLTMDGNSGMALDNSLRVLAYLGEQVSIDLDEEAILRELTETHKCVQQILPLSLDTIPDMKDPLKIKAMVRLASFLLKLLLPRQKLICHNWSWQQKYHSTFYTSLFGQVIKIYRF